MTTSVGVWIDLSHARLVTLSAEAEPLVVTVESEVPPHHKGQHEGHPRVGPGQEHLPGPKANEDRRREAQIDRFFAKVRGMLGPAGRIALFGPDTTRSEFEKSVRADRALGARLEAVVGSDRLTDAQLIAKTREVFGSPPPRQKPTRQRL